jgi:membrane-associated PAP2 superfamily phosphatase
VLVVGIAIVLIGSWWDRRLRRHRVVAVFLGICLALGPGLIVNAIFKKNLGRPRPYQVTRYGGEFEYKAVWQPALHLEECSFPCGDASIGFLFALPAFLVARRNRLAGWSWLAFGGALGLGIGLSRVAAGAHWPSDVLWSAGFVFLTGYLTSLVMFRSRGGRKARSPGNG